MSDDTRVIETIKKTMPAVVSIMIAKHLEDLEKDVSKELYHFFPGHTPTKKEKEQFKIPENVVDEHGMVQVGGGSGFFVAEDGIILTNKHVMADHKAEYTVVTNDGSKFIAEILSIDPVNDVAILRIPAKNMPVVPLGDASKLELGQSVIAIGNALGLFKNTVSLGIVSGLSRSISAKEDPKAPAQELRGLIQTDAAINPGNSGGPLVSLNGMAIGINAAIVFGAQNIGFAIPINSAERDLDDIRKFGRIRRPLLGVRYITIDKTLQAKMKLPVDYGALIIKESPYDHGVIPGSPADVAGVKERDIVLACNGKTIDRDHPIQDILETMSVGETLHVRLLHNGEEHDAHIVLAERK